MKKLLLRTFATSIAFSFSAVGISLFMWALEATGRELVPGQQVESWLQQGMWIVVYALLVGFMIDSLRWITKVAWVPAPDYSHKRYNTEVWLTD